jgi:hypothetical protein
MPVSAIKLRREIPIDFRIPLLLLLLLAALPA